MLFSIDLIPDGSIFQTVGATTEKVVVFILLIFAIEAKRKLELYERSWTGFLTAYRSKQEYSVNGCL